MSSWAFTGSFAHWLGGRVNAVNRSACPDLIRSPVQMGIQPLKEEHEALGHQERLLGEIWWLDFQGESETVQEVPVGQRGPGGGGLRLWMELTVHRSSSSRASGGFSVPWPRASSSQASADAQSPDLGVLPNSSGRPCELEMWNV